MSALGENIQAIFAPKSDTLKSEIKEVEISQNIENELSLSLKGKVIEIEYIPDDVFAMKMMGEGFVIKLDSGSVASLVNGIIGTVFPTKYVVVIKAMEEEKY